jgi:hypothetical protein
VCRRSNVILPAGYGCRRSSPDGGIHMRQRK